MVLLDPRGCHFKFVLSSKDTRLLPFFALGGERLGGAKVLDKLGFGEYLPETTSVVAFDHVPGGGLRSSVASCNQAHLMLCISSLPGHQVPAATMLSPPGLTAEGISINEDRAIWDRNSLDLIIPSLDELIMDRIEQRTHM